MKIIITILVLLSGFASTQLFAQVPSKLDLRPGDSEHAQPDGAEMIVNDVPLLELSEKLSNQDVAAAASTNDSGDPINRLAAVLDYWIRIIDSPTSDANQLKDILAEGFQINFSTLTIDSTEGLAAWLAGVRARTAFSSHRVYATSYTLVGEKKYRMVAELDWEGVDSTGSEWVGKSRHNWLVIDNPNERFMKIVTIDVDMLVPFTQQSE